MEQASDDEPIPDILWLVEMVGIRKVFVEQIGLKRLVDEVGLKRLIDEVGLGRLLNAVGVRRLVDEIGLQRFLDEIDWKALTAQLTPEKRAEIIRRLQGGT